MAIRLPLCEVTQEGYRPDMMSDINPLARPRADSARRREALFNILRAGSLGAATVAAAWWLRGRSHRPEEEEAITLKRNFLVPTDSRYPEIVVAHGEDPRALVRKAIEGLGGIRRFIGRGDVVVIKPNIAWDRTPEQAANTNPLAVAEMVRQCLDAGAKKVIVTDVSCNRS